MVEFDVVWVYVFRPCPLTLSLVIFLLGHIVPPSTYDKEARRPKGLKQIRQPVGLIWFGNYNVDMISVVSKPYQITAAQWKLKNFTIIIIFNTILEVRASGQMMGLKLRHQQSLLYSVCANNHCWAPFHIHTTTVIIRVVLLLMLLLLLLSYSRLVTHRELTYFCRSSTNKNHQLH